ncbi:MAG: hypothetical protein ACD_42C00069G0002 [uncultured bacterium]|nr:MAG: hypothetical protein ACD_42C00069G0002 [uncultured bacterium]OGT25752.1 MAG: ornithine cyclodeaminase [Gammaproteobacteria bacterium RIFCSPHIGHO2_02_FULL_42_43]OGT51700.1 MAG: ornithine cyclodeaminase [Gammaproteobacteria bacterium RIFCSPHIGHO2_12_FULL_41_25]OGT61597.1 MAG: ornithine cyclodeaminase [Gammaproteobacteria bacterium RIFCSPLOWO2_02_FULL_42_14]OGT86221.1 MAG: ornithine cyclodeaminase [Gammaproteobacteria bacterium RIFCSPLOWO2_12_FULL_42_18]
MKLITIANVKTLIHKISIEKFFQLLIAELEKTYARWSEFEKSPRHAVHVKNGVIELMPICDEQYYAFKYVNGHPANIDRNKLTVVGVGMLADVETGYPLMISEMTLLTAFRTAATSTLAAKYLAKKNVKTVGIIGTGAQSEFQIMAQKSFFNVDTVKYFDIDPAAMQKFQNNLKKKLKLIPCDDAASVVVDVDIITTATASKKKANVLQADMIYPGLHMNSIGGDCPGKTELDKAILSKTKIVVEYFPQSKAEGEIQSLGGDDKIYAELWEIVSGRKKGRENDTEITLFDSVGFAIEDYAILKLIYELSNQYQIGQTTELIPELKNSKNLFEVL